jgi:hypothetical protein
VCRREKGVGVEFAAVARLDAVVPGLCAERPSGDAIELDIGVGDDTCSSAADGCGEKYDDGCDMHDSLWRVEMRWFGLESGLVGVVERNEFLKDREESQKKYVAETNVCMR